MPVGQQQPQLFRKRGGVLGHLQRGQSWFGRGTVLELRQIQHQPLIFAVRAAALLVEALAGLIAQPAPLHNLLQYRRKTALRDALGKIRGHMGQNVDAHQVRQPEGAGARPADSLPGQRVHLFDGQPLLQHQGRRIEHHGDADAVGDEVGRVASKHHLLAQSQIGEGGKGGCHGRIGLRGGNLLQQPHIARRIEEVCPEEALPVRGQPRGDLAHRQSGGIGGEHGMGREMRHNAGQQFRLDSQVLGHSLDHPVACSQFAQVVLKVTCRDERGQRGLIEGGGLGLAECVERGQSKPIARAIAGRNKVEEQRGNSGIGQVGSNAGTHGPGAQHRGAADQKRLCGIRRSRAHACAPCFYWIIL